MLVVEEEGEGPVDSLADTVDGREVRVGSSDIKPVGLLERQILDPHTRLG